MAEPDISIKVVGSAETLRSLRAQEAAFARGTMRGVRDTTLLIRGRIKEGFGRPGRPRRGKGDMSRGVLDVPPRRDGNIVIGVVGMSAAVKQARILEFGGPVPEIRPVRAKALRFTGGLTRLAGLVGLEFGITRRQAKLSFRRGERRKQNDLVFVTRVGPRYQRALPYFRPGVDEARPQIPDIMRARIVEALAGKSGVGGVEAP